MKNNAKKHKQKVFWNSPAGVSLRSSKAIVHEWVDDESADRPICFICGKKPTKGRVKRCLLFCRPRVCIYCANIFHVDCQLDYDEPGEAVLTPTSLSTTASEFSGPATGNSLTAESPSVGIDKAVGAPVRLSAFQELISQESTPRDQAMAELSSTAATPLPGDGDLRSQLRKRSKNYPS